MKFIAKTLYGLEKVLAGEIISMGATDVGVVNRAVLFRGDKELLYTVNYCARTALSVLMQVAEFRIRSKDDLYKGGSEIDWSVLMDPDDTFSVVPVVNSPYFTHTGYPGLILKDAIADWFRKKSGRRPSVNHDNPVVVINLHISNDQVTISLDSSVVPLFKRGYRQDQVSAPLNEVLAAGILLISGWNASADLTDPMCGSGTIPIEAALMACNIPPGKTRQYFGFQRWKDFDEELFEKVKQDAEARIRSSPVRISGSDISEQAVIQARANVERAGLRDVVSLEVADFAALKPAGDPGFLFLNPPYGERLLPDDTDRLYSIIGTTLKHNFHGYTAWLITSNRESLKKVGLKPGAKFTVFNGALECLLLKYEMYQGTRKINSP
jgi:23S rRNA (guanine2445-N2)-methyltransferase